MNQLAATVMADLPRFDTPDGLARRRQANDLLPSPTDAVIVERSVPGSDGDIAVRVLTPERVDAVYLDLHGGGWGIGSATEDDFFNWEMAQATDVAVISVDYRLAPEHPFPAGPDDCEAAARWLVEHGSAEFGTDRLFIGGGSAGAHLSALTLLRLRDRHGIDVGRTFLGANLIFGCYDLGYSPSVRAADERSFPPPDEFDAIMANFLPGLDAEARRKPEISPLYADLHDLPPALFTVGTADPLLDDSMFMAARWDAAGNEAELAIYPEGIHAFVAFPIEIARIARRRTYDWIGERIAASAAVAP